MSFKQNEELARNALKAQGIEPGECYVNCSSQVRDDFVAFRTAIDEQNNSEFRGCYIREGEAHVIKTVFSFNDLMCSRW